MLAQPRPIVCGAGATLVQRILFARLRNKKILCYKRMLQIASNHI